MASLERSNNSGDNLPASGSGDNVAVASTANNNNVPVPTGYVERRTLYKIHRILLESLNPKDHEHAKWLKSQYLEGYKGGEQLELVRDIEGYKKIDDAFRRVRTLTNKARDKWPFMTEDFKRLPAKRFRSLYPVAPSPALPKGWNSKSHLVRHNTLFSPPLHLLILLTDTRFLSQVVLLSFPTQASTLSAW